MINNRKSYKLYKKECENPIDMKTYLEILDKYHNFLMSKILSNHVVQLPCRFGTLEVLGKKEKIKRDEEGNLIGLAPDWVKTKELWKLKPETKKERKVIYHLNPHTGGVRYRFFWSKRNVFVENKTLYSLRLTRTNKRALVAKIKAGVKYKTDTYDK